MANLSLVRSSMGDGPLAGQIEDAAKASESGCRMAEQLLSFARGGDKGERVEADLGRLLSEAARLSTYGAKARCDVSVGPDLWSAIVNVTQVTQVINNLIINARQAMGDAGTFQARVGNVALAPGEVDELPQGNYLRLDVIDHGCGIPPDKMADIFTAFYTTKETGNGLGLATCQMVIREHGGLITVDSDEGRGARFSVYVPSTGEGVEPYVEAGAREVFRGAGSVLVVDDQEPILRVAKALLEQLGYEVVCAASGEDGVAKYRRRRSDGQPVSAVLMDMTLPGGIDGGEATGQILEIDPEAKVIASSGYLEDSMGDAQRSRGYAGVLSKPYDLEKVSRVLHEVLRGEEILEG
jgi:CheY-like chemotaxis protein